MQISFMHLKVCNLLKNNPFSANCATLIALIQGVNTLGFVDLKIEDLELKPHINMDVDSLLLYSVYDRMSGFSEGVDSVLWYTSTSKFLKADTGSGRCGTYRVRQNVGYNFA